MRSQKPRGTPGVGEARTRRYARRSRAGSERLVSLSHPGREEGSLQCRGDATKVAYGVAAHIEHAAFAVVGRVEMLLVRFAPTSSLWFSKTRGAKRVGPAFRRALV